MAGKHIRKQQVTLYMKIRKETTTCGLIIFKLDVNLT